MRYDVLLAAVLLAGCAHQPVTQQKVQVKAQKVQVAAPKVQVAPGTLPASPPTFKQRWLRKFFRDRALAK